MSLLSPGVNQVRHAHGKETINARGETELDVALLNWAKIIIEYFPQVQQEGEIQPLSSYSQCIELWKLVTEEARIALVNDETTIFDSVGFAQEDYTVLRSVYDLAREHQRGADISMVPEMADRKNLYQLLTAKAMV